ncbi:Aldehyde dehydrogenase [Kluyveromyces marxianus]
MTKLEYTPLEDIPAKIDSAVEFYKARQLRLSKAKNPLKQDIAERKRCLQRLYWAIKDREEQLVEAMEQDFHRARSESMTVELIPLYNNILYIIDNLEKNIKPKKIKSSGIAYRFGSIVIEKIALGTVLVISPFNFPILLALDPLAGAIAGGNSVVFKPSELTGNCARLMEEICREAFEPGHVETVQGGVEETTVLLDSGKFDKIFYTGSPAVGAIIAEKAGKSLTPCVLELGGKSPAFVTENLPKSKWDTAVRRIFFSSFGNSGQICVAADYILCHESIYEEFTASCKKILHEFFPKITPETEYTYMVHNRASDRIKKILDSSKGEKFAAQNDGNLPETCIPPTLIINATWDDSSMESENFGPILPIVKYSDLDRAIDQVLQRHDMPLVQYVFSDSKSEAAHITTRIRSGDCIIGDTMIHVGIEEAPFGGIRSSGYGNYHGTYTFKTFTHERTVFKQSYWVDILINIRYPPFDKFKTRVAQISTESKPNFDRNGNKTFNYKLFGFVLVSGIVLAFLLRKWT